MLACPFVSFLHASLRLPSPFPPLPFSFETTRTRRRLSQVRHRVQQARALGSAQLGPQQAPRPHSPGAVHGRAPQGAVPQRQLLNRASS